jgi:hypothetical protein
MINGILEMEPDKDLDLILKDLMKKYDPDYLICKIKDFDGRGLRCKK